MGAALLLVALDGVLIWGEQPRRSILRPEEAQAGAPAPAPSPVQAPVTSPGSAPAGFEQALQQLASDYNGDAGVAVMDLKKGWIASYQGARPFPQQSVSKLWVAVGLLDEVDRGRVRLDKVLTIRRQDLSLFSEPIQALVKPVYRASLAELLERAIRDSDNAANDLLAGQAGGVQTIEAIMARKGLHGIAIGADEKHLQGMIAGVPWRPEFAGNSGFVTARARLPAALREAKLDAYVRDPMDGATPVGTVKGLAALAEGRLLSPSSTQRLLAIMREVRTGKRRLKGGLQRGWTLGHKTGTGPDLRGASVGINDVGLMTAPDGHQYAVAVFIARTRAPVPERLAFMQHVAELVEQAWSGRAPPAGPAAKRGGRHSPHQAQAHRERRRHRRR